MKYTILLSYIIILFVSAGLIIVSIEVNGWGITTWVSIFVVGLAISVLSISIIEYYRNNRD